ncbi:hypothetical protein V1527DRAFT_295858 [Lipomyces starkeyi]
MYASSCSYLYMTVMCFNVFYVSYRFSTFFVGFGSTALGQMQGLRSDMVFLCALIAWTCCIGIGIALRSHDFLLSCYTKFCSGFNCVFVYDTSTSCVLAM